MTFHPLRSSPHQSYRLAAVHAPVGGDGDLSGLVAITFGIPFAIFAEAALSFIGLATPGSLGILISQGYSTIQRNVWNVVFPAGAVAVLMLSFTFVGDGLRDALDPRSR